MATLRGSVIGAERATRRGAVAGIAARVGVEATVKTLQHRGATIVLEPANPDERELVISPTDDFAVIGTIAAVFRPFHDAAQESDDAGAPPEDNGGRNA